MERKRQNSSRRKQWGYTSNGVHLCPWRFLPFTAWEKEKLRKGSLGARTAGVTSAMSQPKAHKVNLPKNTALVTSLTCPHLHLPITRQERVLLSGTQSNFSSMLSWRWAHVISYPPLSEVGAILQTHGTSPLFFSFAHIIIPSTVMPCLLDALTNLPLLQQWFQRPPILQSCFCSSPKIQVTFHDFELFFVFEVGVTAKLQTPVSKTSRLLTWCIEQIIKESESLIPSSKNQKVKWDHVKYPQFLVHSRMFYRG